MSKYEELKQIIASIEDDVDKFYNKENKAAGTRVRSTMQEIKKIAQEIRNEVQSIKNNG